MHILLIEDDLDLGPALQAALLTEGHSSTWLRRANDAPWQLDAAAQDAVLLDQTLPDGDGRQLLTRWRRQGSTVPVLVITARAALDDRRAAGRQGHARRRPRAARRLRRPLRASIAGLAGPLGARERCAPDGRRRLGMEARAAGLGHRRVRLLRLAPQRRRPLHPAEGRTGVGLQVLAAPAS
ncbi:MAG: response regulator [Burkholderiales bacterium]|nr:response regulator [Burkholderiales bacterium]